MDAMKESINWYRPKCNNNLLRFNILDLRLPEDMVELGKLSQEKIEHDNRISNKLPAMYFKVYFLYDSINLIRNIKYPINLPSIQSSIRTQLQTDLS